MTNFKLNTKTFLIIVTIILVAFALTIDSANPIPETSVVNTQEETNPIAKSFVTQTIGEETQSIEIAPGDSVLDVLLKTKADSVEVEEYSIGTLVSSINGIKNGEDNKYWVYTINNESVEVGASDFILKDGDAIKWEFKEYEEE